jgi:hypothetical protein
MLTIVAWMAAVLACAVMVVLLLPLTFEWEVASGTVRTRLRWAYAGVSLDLGRPRTDRRAHADAKAGARAKTRGPNARVVMQVLAAPGFRTALGKVLHRLLRALHPHAVRVQAVLNLGDPAATGMLWSAVGPLAPLLCRRRWGTVDLRPAFDEEATTFRGRGRFTVIPVEVVTIAVAFLFSPAVMHAAWTLAEGRRQ